MRDSATNEGEPGSLDPALERRLRRDGPEVLPTWFLPGAPPTPEHLDEGAHSKAIGDWVRRRGRTISSAPSLATQYLVILQRCIDEWDAQACKDVLVELLVYIDIIHDLLDNADLDHEDHRSVAELLRLDRGLNLAREVQPADVHANLVDAKTMFESTLSDVIHLLRLTWRRGIPQRAALEPLDPIDFDDWPRVRADLRAGAHLLYATLRHHGPDDPDMQEPLCEDLARELRWRLAGPDRQIAPLPSLLEDPSLPAGDRARQGIKTRDAHVFYEFLAHRFAYAPHLPVFQHAVINNGYDLPFSFASRTGLNFYILLPTERLRGFLPPIVAFRGTQPDDLNDIRTDLEFQIGDAHFQAVRAIGLEELLMGAAADCKGYLPVVIGHSLGGALAQLTAAHWPHLVGSVVTFQAPGVSRENERRLARNLAAAPQRPPLPELSSAHGRRTREANNRLQVTHYIADQDVVHLAGQVHLPGTTILVTGLHVHRRHDLTWGLCHTSMLLTGHEMAETLQIMGLASAWSPHTTSAFARLPEHPSAQRVGHEMIRGGIALGVDLVQTYLRGDRRPQELAAHARTLVARALAKEEASLVDGVRTVGQLLAQTTLGVTKNALGAALGSRRDRETVEELAHYAEEEVRLRVMQGLEGVAPGHEGAGRDQ